VRDLDIKLFIGFLLAVLVAGIGAVALIALGKL
jgi:hypothetical protein